MSERKWLLRSGAVIIFCLGTAIAVAAGVLFPYFLAGWISSIPILVASAVITVCAVGWISAWVTGRIWQLQRRTPFAAIATVAIATLFTIVLYVSVLRSTPEIPVGSFGANTNYWQLPTGSRIAYYEYDPPSNAGVKSEPILFLHGGPGFAITPFEHSFFRQFAADEYRVYLYDQAGSGLSAFLSPRQYTYKSPGHTFFRLGTSCTHMTCQPRRCSKCRTQPKTMPSQGRVFSNALVALGSKKTCSKIRVSAPGEPSVWVTLFRSESRMRPVMQVKSIVLCTIVALVASPLFAQVSASGSSAKFAQMCEDFIHERLAISPSWASMAGYHYHLDPKTGKRIALDALLDDVSPTGLAEQRRVYATWHERFHSEIPLASLGPADAADWRLIDDQIGLGLLEFDSIQSYKHDPTLYVERIGRALFQPLTDDFAAEDERLGDVISRVEAVPSYLDQARAELADADPIFIKVAEEENDGNVDLIQGKIANAIHSGTPLKTRFDKAAPAAVQSLKSFSSWLQNDLAKRKADRTWRLGKELYAEKFRLVMETAITPEQVLSEPKMR